MRVDVHALDAPAAQVQQTEAQVDVRNFQGIYLSPQQAKALAARRPAGADDDAVVGWLWREALCRAPSARERAAARAWLADVRPAADADALAAVRDPGQPRACMTAVLPMWKVP